MCSISNNNNYTGIIGLFECQDGITNNCSKSCTRRLINETMSYEYECACDAGYAANHFGYCEGKNLLNDDAVYTGRILLS